MPCPPPSALGLSCPSRSSLRHCASAQDYGQAVELAAQQADAVLAIVVPPVDVGGGKIDAAVEAAQDTGKPVLVAVLSFDGAVPPGLGAVPSYPSPDSAVQALARAVEYAEFRARPVGQFPMPPPVDIAAARAAATEGRITDLLRVYGITVDPAVPVRTAHEAVDAANPLGWPVALKSAEPAHQHRQELSGARLEIADEEQLRAAFDTRQCGRTRARRATGSPTGGGRHRWRRGGPHVRPARVVWRRRRGDRPARRPRLPHPPLSDLDAAELVRSVRAAPLLFGYAAAPPVDVEALEQLLLRVARLADELPTVTGTDTQMLSLELNPVIVGTSGVRVLAAQARMGPPPQGRTPVPRTSGAVPGRP